MVFVTLIIPDTVTIGKYLKRLLDYQGLVPLVPLVNVICEEENCSNG